MIRCTLVALVSLFLFSDLVGAAASPRSLWDFGESAQQPRALQIEIEADRMSREGPQVTYVGRVEIRYGTMSLRADRVVYNEATEDAEAAGNLIVTVDGQHLFGRRARFHFKTGQGTIWEAHGVTDRAPDGTRLYFEAERIDRIAPDTFVIHRGRVTACQGSTPIWSFTTRRMKLRVKERVSLLWPAFRVKGIPILALPYVSVPLPQRVRKSGFLLPGIGNSTVKGFSLAVPYYQTLGRSADLTARVHLFSARGLGYGADLRWRTREDSSLETGFFLVQDRLFGPPGPDQGGTAYYLRAVQYFPRGFVGTADVSLTSSLAFRQVFSDNFQQAISPEERIQIALTKNFGAYSFNVLLSSRDVFLPTTPVTLRQLPSFHLTGRPRRLSERAPFYFSFDAAIEGIARKERSLRTPSLVQRFDAHPRFALPLFSGGGVSVVPEIGVRATFYSESADPADRTRILGRSWVRRYVDASITLELPTLLRVFSREDGRPGLRHLIESRIVYRRRAGVGRDFARAILVDERDIVPDTHEIEYAMEHRFLGDGASSSSRDRGGEPIERLSIRIAQKYFFDPQFGGAWRAEQRNQILPIVTLSGFSFGGRARHSSPIRVDARVRPLSSLFADVRFDFDATEKTVRALGLTAGLTRERFASAHTWYWVRRIPLAAGRFEPDTFSGNLYHASLILGDSARGLFVGADVLYDFTDRAKGKPGASAVPLGGESSGFSRGRLISSSVRIGYGFECCSLQIQSTTFRIGVRNETRFALAIVLNGIGSFGPHTGAGRRSLDPYSPF